MLRNIPNKMHLPDLKKFIDRSSYGKYDFIYLRIDFQNDCNVGYAFINFENSESIINFMLDINNKRWDEFRSWKVAEVSYATIQGKDCLIQKFRNSSVMKEFDGYRPKVSSVAPAIEISAPLKLLSFTLLSPIRNVAAKKRHSQSPTTGPR